jgi:hypothetical protein
MYKPRLVDRAEPFCQPGRQLGSQWSRFGSGWANALGRSLADGTRTALNGNPNCNLLIRGHGQIVGAVEWRPLILMSPGVWQEP